MLIFGIKLVCSEVIKHFTSEQNIGMNVVPQLLKFNTIQTMRYSLVVKNYLNILRS